MIITVDIDGTLCTKESDYERCLPYLNVILNINELYNAGHTIKIHTARSFKRLAITYRQLKQWGVKYHELIMDKPKSCKYIDVDSLKPEELDEFIENSSRGRPQRGRDKEPGKSRFQTSKY